VPTSLATVAVSAVDTPTAASAPPLCTRPSLATAHFAVDVASWTDEESTYLGMVGSKSFCGLLPPGAVDAARSEVGVRDEQGLVKIAPQEPLLDALARAGLAGRDTLTMEPGRYVGFFEAHIEQGPSLEASGNQIGVGERVYLPC
jgi:N-carbamoyl-L-amino-acid hydrolase